MSSKWIFRIVWWSLGAVTVAAEQLDGVNAYWYLAIYLALGLGALFGSWLMFRED